MSQGVVEVNLKHIRSNFLILKKILDGGFLCPMVKTNAYGHGRNQVANALLEAGCERVGYGFYDEALSGPKNIIKLVFGEFAYNDLNKFNSYLIEPVISDIDQIKLLSSDLKTPLKIHLKFNTGMNRLGFSYEQIPLLVKFLEDNKNISLVGVCTHLQTAEDISEKAGSSDKQIKMILKIFETFVNFGSPQLHVLNSQGLVSLLKSGHIDQVNTYGARPGLLLYGCTPNGSSHSLLKKLKPAMSFSSHISHIRDVKKGDTVSYGGDWTANSNTRVGIIPIGYGNGLSRYLSNSPIVKVRDVYVPILGKVTMDYIMVDLSGSDLLKKAPNIKRGEKIVFFDDEHSLKKIASKSLTIPYETLINIGTGVNNIISYID